MNRRGFLAALLGLPAAYLAGLRWPRLKTPPIRYSMKPYMEWQAKEIARIFAIPPELIADPKHSTFGFAAGQQTRAYFDHILRPHLERLTSAEPK
jgi:hypothetical protein